MMEVNLRNLKQALREAKKELNFGLVRFIENEIFSIQYQQDSDNCDCGGNCKNIFRCRDDGVGGPSEGWSNPENEW